MTNRIDLLETAIKLTGSDRNQAYGNPFENHQHIALIFNAITGRSLSSADIALVHIATKLARMRTSPGKEDHYVDLMAYAGILFECHQLLENSATVGVRPLTNEEKKAMREFEKTHGGKV